MTTQTIVFALCYLIGVAAAFRAGKSYWIRKFLNKGYVLMDLRTLNALSKISEDLNKELRRIEEKQKLEEQNGIS